MNDYLSQTELGRIYGVSSHQVGKWLKSLGLRTPNGRPSSEAFSEGMVDQRPSRGIGTYFYVWHAQKTTDLLDRMGYPRDSSYAGSACSTASAR